MALGTPWAGLTTTIASLRLTPGSDVSFHQAGSSQCGHHVQTRLLRGIPYGLISYMGWKCICVGPGLPSALHAARDDNSLTDCSTCSLLLVAQQKRGGGGRGRSVALFVHLAVLQLKHLPTNA